jgi:hypothetical protein
MKRITDDTIVKVKVPKHLYESIMAKMALKEKETKASEQPEEKKSEYAGMKMSKGGILDKLGKTRPNTVFGKNAMAYTAPHSNASVKEDAMDYAWVPALAGGLGIAVSMLKDITSYMKQRKLKGFQGFMQAYEKVGRETASGVQKSTGTTN